jgi:hypothetical protein
MELTWEAPPDNVQRPAGFGRQRSALGEEKIKILEQLAAFPGRWARLWDFETKEEAARRTGFMGTKGFSFYVRRNDQGGYSLFGRKREDPQDVETQERPGAFEE